MTIGLPAGACNLLLGCRQNGRRRTGKLKSIGSFLAYRGMGVFIKENTRIMNNAVLKEREELR